MINVYKSYTVKQYKKKKEEQVQGQIFQCQCQGNFFRMLIAIPSCQVYDSTAIFYFFNCCCRDNHRYFFYALESAILLSLICLDKNILENEAQICSMDFVQQPDSKQFALTCLRDEIHSFRSAKLGARMCIGYLLNIFEYFHSLSCVFD